jgi:hypothetical protein
MIRPILFVVTSVLAAAQAPGPRLSVPSLGYVFDGNAKTIRLVSGVPGVASLDDAVLAGTAFNSAFVHTRARVAIANTKDSSLALVQWNGAPQITPLATSLDRAVQVAFSRSGNRAAITDGTSVEVWTGLSAEASKTDSFRLDDGIAALAINDEGTLTAATRAGAVLISDQFSNGSSVLTTGGDWTALAFLPGGTALVGVDAASRSLVLFRDVKTSPSQAVLANLSQAPGALALSADGNSAAVAVAKDIAIVNLAGGDATTVPCGCGPARLDLMEGNLVVHIVDPDSGVSLLLDGDGPEPRISTVWGAAR